MKGFEIVLATQSQLKEQNNWLRTEREELYKSIKKVQDTLFKMGDIKAENVQLREECKSREVREHNLHEVIASFTFSSKIMDKMVNMQKPSKKKKS